jgi:hypothetical protein
MKTITLKIVFAATILFGLFTARIFALDHLATPSLYDNASGFEAYGQTFVADSSSISGVRVYIGDPFYPNDPNVNGLDGPATLSLYNLLSTTSLLASSQIVPSGKSVFGLSTFYFDTPIQTIVGSSYFFGISSADTFGIGLRQPNSSTYAGGAEAWRNQTTGLITQHFNGRDLSFKILTAPSAPPSPPSRETALPITSIPQTSSVLSYAMPVRSTVPVVMTTEPGGPSSVYSAAEGYFDHFHSPNEGYYSIDFDVADGRSAQVVAAKAGTIVAVTSDSVTISHGGGYFTEYREFALSASLTVGQVISEQAFQSGFVLGTLTGASTEHLHFQVKYSGDPNVFGPGLSTEPNPSNPQNAALRDVTVGGRRFRDYTLNRSSSGLPLSTPVVGIAPLTALYTQRETAFSFANPAATATSQTGSVSFTGDAFTLQTGSPVWMSSLVETTQVANFLAFDADFTSPLGAEGLLTVYWEGGLLGSIDERYAADGSQEYILALPASVDPGLFDLAFRLDPFTGTSSSVAISNVSTGFAETVPEPSCVIFLLSGVALCLRRRTLRKHGKCA